MESSNTAAGRPPPVETPLDMRIARDGVWHHDGAPIRRPELVRLFASVLRRDDAGAYWLVTPAERARVEVEDAPFLAVEMEVRRDHGTDILAFRTNVGDWVEAGPDHPLRVVTDRETGQPRPYIQVRQGLEARIVRPVFYELVGRSVAGPGNGEDGIGVWSRGTFFALATSHGD